MTIYRDYDGEYVFHVSDDGYILEAYQYALDFNNGGKRIIFDSNSDWGKCRVGMTWINYKREHWPGGVADKVFKSYKVVETIQD